MLAVDTPSAAFDPDPEFVLPAQPKSVRDTGLPQQLIAELIAKALLVAGKSHLPVLSTRLHLPINVLREVLECMVAEQLLELAWHGESELDVQYQLTTAGRQRATAWSARCAYVGAAPVTLEAYRSVVERQASSMPLLCADELAAEFADNLLSPAMLRMLGAAMYAGRTILLHGPSGSGKSLLARRLVGLLQGLVAVPHALLVGQEIVQLYDAMLHRTPTPQQLRASRAGGERRSSDPRWLLCQRPLLSLDADMSADVLELQADQHSACYRAPPQLKANHGLLIVDDLGRQRIAAAELVNRLGLACELERSQLALGGYQFDVPCRLQLVFVTSLTPAALLDGAALRRIAYTIAVGALDAASYAALFRRQCEHAGVRCDEAVLRYLVEQLHRRSGLPLLACYPHEILRRISDFAGFLGQPVQLSVAALEQAWASMLTTALAATVDGAALEGDVIDQLQRRIA